MLTPQDPFLWRTGQRCVSLLITTEKLIPWLIDYARNKTTFKLPGVLFLKHGGKLRFQAVLYRRRKQLPVRLFLRKNPILHKYFRRHKAIWNLKGSLRSEFFLFGCQIVIVDDTRKSLVTSEFLLTSSEAFSYEHFFNYIRKPQAFWL